jgi:hypothetical protein
MVRNFRPDYRGLDSTTFRLTKFTDLININSTNYVAALSQGACSVAYFKISQRCLYAAYLPLVPGLSDEMAIRLNQLIWLIRVLSRLRIDG